jgi:hypothetical protein
VIEYADFFALYPNDARPPITLDGNTARRIISGQLSPESVYFDRTSGDAVKAAKSQNEGSGNGSVGWQMAESTYVPVGMGGKAASSMNATTSAVLLSHAASASNAQRGPAAAMAPGAGYSGSAANAAAGIATGEISVGNSAGVGTFSSAMPGTSMPGSSAGGRAPASSGAAYSGSASAGSGNQTYSQMIDAAMSNATQSLCGRMGAYAGAGQCK